MDERAPARKRPPPFTRHLRARQQYIGAASWPSWRMFGLFDEHDNTQLVSSLSLAAWTLQILFTPLLYGRQSWWVLVVCPRQRGRGCRLARRISRLAFRFRACQTGRVHLVDLHTILVLFTAATAKVCLMHVCMYAPVFFAYIPAHDIIRRVRSTHCGEIASPPEAGKSIMFGCVHTIIHRSHVGRRQVLGALSRRKVDTCCCTILLYGRTWCVGS